jgi:hypothetical protein
MRVCVCVCVYVCVCVCVRACVRVTHRETCRTGRARLELARTGCAAASHVRHRASSFDSPTAAISEHPIRSGSGLGGQHVERGRADWVPVAL